ncbi:hypothetical protein LX99_02355 [Mucilaginibacter oryzae]|uniref:Uncharacterized protein n=1 Tax=Mucilaginibacter oryzae TaxID=468058 RepID=A0A316HEQ9_9SPHI|nr:hypothetical protein LX99_02355 [Mucilaginibacter oryzae]
MVSVFVRLVNKGLETGRRTDGINYFAVNSHQFIILFNMIGLVG